MIRSVTRWAALACTAAALALSFAAAPVHGATFTFSDPNCSSFSFDPATSTLSCVVSTVPTCTVTGPSTGTLGSPITLTASCSPAAISYSWSGGTCTTGQACQDTQTVGGTVTYKVTGTNGVGPGPQSPAFNVAWSNTVPARPSGCTIVQSNPAGTLPVGGGSPTLTANCTGGGAVASWSWTGGFAQGATSAIVTGSVLSSTQFTATATNAGGSTATNYTVNVATGGGGGGPISCPGFATTRVLDMNWTPKPQLGYTVNVGGFGPNDAIVVRFTTSASTTSTAMGYIQAAEFSDPPSGRTAALSATPCDFVGLPKVGGGTTAFGPGDIAPKAYFTLFNPNTGNPTLLPSTTYYFNISNSTPSSCQSSGSCNMIITLSKPSGS